MNGKCLEILARVNECTEYKVRGREGKSEVWIPARGLRVASPILFNVYHQATMRQEEEKREKRTKMRELA